MTPLAHLLTKRACERRTRRGDIWGEPQNIALLGDALDNIQCFEVTEALLVRKAQINGVQLIGSSRRRHMRPQTLRSPEQLHRE
jgi:hypothetical protein